MGLLRKSIQGWLRTDEQEIVDREGPNERGQRILAELDRFNRRFGWNALHVRQIRRHWQALGEPEPLRILDIGSGPGGLLAALRERFAKTGPRVELVGVERNPAYAAMARARVGAWAEIVEADARALPFDDHAFHVATTTLTLHHLPQSVRRELVAEMGRVCRSAYIFDLEVTLYAVVGWPIVAPFVGMGADARRDGLTSIRRGCTFDEFRQLVSPLPVEARRAFPSALYTAPRRPATP